MAERWLDQYRDEIVFLYEDQEMTQANIRQFLESKYNIQVPKATLSVYLKGLPQATRPPAPGETRLTPEEKQFMAQVETLAFFKESCEQLMGAMAQMLGRMQVLEDAAAERHRDMQAALRQVGEGQGKGFDAAQITVPMKVLMDEIAKQGRVLDAVRQRAGVRAVSTSGWWQAVKRWTVALLISGGLWGLFWAFEQPIVAFVTSLYHDTMGTPPPQPKTKPR